MIQDMSFTVSRLAVVGIGAWFSGVEMEVNVKDDMVACYWVETVA